MKNIIFLLILILSLSCKGQQVYPLKTDYTEIPANSYLKDLNNELDTYVGNWKATYNNETIELFISKETYKHFKTKYEYYKDALSVRYIIRNSSGIIAQNTQNMNFQPYQIRHTIYSRWVENGNQLLLYYGGTNCGVGWGNILLKKINPTQLSWEYRPNDIILDDSRCPAGTDISIYLPETKDLIFTKQ